MPKKIRILCEGISDQDSLKEIFKKESIKQKIVQLKSRERLLKKVNQYIDTYKELVDKFIIIVDSHCTDPLKTYQKVYDNILDQNRDKIEIHIIKHALENWFLSEENAIKERFKIKFKSIPNVDEICRPDETLKELIRKSGRLRYQKSIHAKAISELLDTEELKRKSKNFDKFIKLVINSQIDD